MIDVQCQSSILKKFIPSHQFEKEILDSNAGVETTFHHGVNVIIIHVVSAKLYVHIVQSRASNVSNNFFVFCIFLFYHIKFIITSI